MSPAALAALTAVSAWYQAQGLPAPQRDPRLDAAAAIAAQRAADGAHTEEDLRFSLRRAGIVDHEILTIRSGGSPGRVLTELDRQAGAASAMTHWGGAGEDTTVVLVRRMVQLDQPPPLEVRADFLEIKGRLAPGWRTLQVVYSGPDGAVADAAVRREQGGAFTVRAPMRSGSGRYRVELLVEGPTVAALFSVWRQQAAPAVPEVRVPAPFHSLAASLQELRARAGAAPLRRLDALDAVALAHSADMARRSYFAHRSPDGPGPLERVHRGGLKVGRVLENIATASSPAKAHMQVLDSPAHLRNMIDPTVTDYGIGVYEEAGVSYVTWLFSRPRTSSGAGRARTSAPARPTP